mgnify:CR=1 FL=1
MALHAAVAIFFASASRGCLLFEDHCDFSSIESESTINCYFLGDAAVNETFSPNPKVATSFSVLFSKNAVASQVANCPGLSLNNIQLNVYLEPCLEVARQYNRKKNPMALSTRVKNLNRQAFNAEIYAPLPKCTPMIHIVNESIMTEPTTSEYDSGITISSAARLAGAASLIIGDTPKPVVTRSKFVNLDATCNVFGISMPKTTLSYLVLDNTDCVNAALPTQKDLDNALQTYGPDQLEVLRISKYFEQYDPVLFQIKYIDLSTYKPYRTKYPGRSLISVDAKNDKKYPPDPITVDNSFFDAIVDLHSVPVEVPAGNADEVANGEWRCCPNASLCTKSSPNYLPPNPSIASSLGLYTLVPTCNGTNSSFPPINATASCFAGESEQTPIVINVTGVPLVKCTTGRYSKNATNCPTGSAYDNALETCVTLEAQRVNSRPIDIIMWNFRGDVTFGKNWDSGSGRIFTVLVFGNREITSLGTLSSDTGEVYEDYIDNNTNIAFRLPDPGLNLLVGCARARLVFNF